MEDLTPNPSPKGEGNWAVLFRRFEEERKQNSDAIAELAVQNFVEMRDLVGHPDFLLRKKIDGNESVFIRRRVGPKKGYYFLGGQIAYR